MIEKLVSLKIPPGIVKSGTLEDRAGRWIDSNFLRFIDGVPTPIGSADELSLTGTNPSGGVATAAWSWFTVAGGNQNVVCGKQTKLYRFNSLTTTILDITPAGITDQGFSHSTWSFTNLGDLLLFSRASGPGAVLAGNLYKWDQAVGGIATVVTNAPTVAVRGVVVTPEQFVMVLYDDRTVKWASQGTTTVWTPTGTNSAGELDVPTAGQMLRLIVVGDETVALGDQDAWVMDYVGADLIYGSRRIGEKCGLLSPNAAVASGNTFYWMGQRGFFQYDGFVRALDCPIADTIFSDFNHVADARMFAIAVPSYNEIWWFYPTAATSNPNRCVRYNTETGAWYLEPLTRSAGIDAVWPANAGATNGAKAPLLFDTNGNTVYAHESPGAMPGAFIESGPISIGDGDQVFRVQKLVPDGAATGDDITLFYGTWPGETESSDTNSVTAGDGPIDVRFSARYVRYKQTLDSISTPSRVGVPKIGIIPSGRR